MGQFTTNGPFSMAMLNNQRVNLRKVSESRIATFQVVTWGAHDECEGFDDVKDELSLDVQGAMARGYCDISPMMGIFYKKRWKDPPFYSWVNPLFRLGHFFHSFL